MRLPTPWHRQRRRRASPPAGEVCLLCGRPVQALGYEVRLVDGGANLLSVEEEPEAPDDMGWYTVGPECARQVPAAFVRRMAGEQSA